MRRRKPEEKPPEEKPPEEGKPEEAKPEDGAVDISELLRKHFNPRPSSPHSLLANLLPIEKDPSILIYGPTKIGKTRLAVWEAAALARELNRRVRVLITESNMEESDFMDLLSICMYHNVMCVMEKYDNLAGLRRYIERVTKDVWRKSKTGELDKVERVYVVDSVTALSEMVTANLPEGLLENPQTAIAYHNPYQIAIIDPLRRLISHFSLAGYLIMVSHETQTRGEPYNPRVEDIKSKPRYTSAGRYKDDAEVFMGENTFNALKGEKCRAWRGTKALVVVRSRRNPESEGLGLSFQFKRVTGHAEGALVAEAELGSATFSFIPADMLEKGEPRRIKYYALVPEIVCGPVQV